ncbi:MAG: RIP metalloprotease RseP [Nitrospinota bacterium]
MIAALLLLGVLIFVHELGHFLVAKKTGVEVEKFSIGFGRKIISRKVGETEYILSLIPLGGYVKMVGEEPEVEVVNPERSFSHKSVWVRLSIVVAGPLFNVVFGVLLLSVVYLVGIKTPSDEAIVGGLKPGYPTADAGFRENDRVVEIDGAPVNSWQEMAKLIHSSPGQSLRIGVERGSKTHTLVVTPKAEKISQIDGEEKEVGLIGISPALVTERFGPFQSISLGVQKTWQITYMTFWAIHKMVVGEISSKNLGGPILIVQKAGEFATEGIFAYAGFAAVISVNLGILNLLPIPILDGGHILFFLLEIIFRRPVSLNIREKAQRAGLAILLSLMVFAFYNDIMRFFEKG